MIIIPLKVAWRFSVHAEFLLPWQPKGKRLKKYPQKLLERFESNLAQTVFG